MLRSARTQLQSERRATMARQERLQVGADRDRAGAGAAATVRRGERLVQVEVTDVVSHVGSADDPEKRIHVRAVHVDLPPDVVTHRRDLQNAALELPERVRVRQHQGPRSQRFDRAFRVDLAYSFERIVTPSIRPRDGGGFVQCGSRNEHAAPHVPRTV